MMFFANFREIREIVHFFDFPTKPLDFYILLKILRFLKSLLTIRDGSFSAFSHCNFLIKLSDFTKIACFRENVQIP